MTKDIPLAILVFAFTTIVVMAGIVPTIEMESEIGSPAPVEGERTDRVARATVVAEHLFEDWYREMTAWAEGREKIYTEEGEPLPFDASIFFKHKYKELLEGDEPLCTALDENEGERETRKWDSYTRTNTGIHCDIYVETGSNSFDSLKNEFDSTIWPSNIEAFGDPGFKADIYIYYTGSGSPDSDGAGGVGGFFTPSRPGRVYIDSSDISGWGYEILAHEFQHLIHNGKDPHELLWLDEGCADYAIIKAYGQNAGGVASHLAYFEAYPDNDLTKFENRPYDYGSTCAYITYLADHYGSHNFVKSLVANQGSGFSGVSSTLSQNGYSDNYKDVFLNWVIANYLDDPNIYDGKFGYTNLNIDVDLEESYSAYPMTASSDVQSWGADYYRFRNGREGLGVEFEGKGGGNDFAVWIAKKGAGDTVVERMSLNANDYGIHPLGGFGGEFSTVIMAVTSDSTAQYDFGIENMDTTPPLTVLTADPAVPDGKNGYYVSNPLLSLSTEAGAASYYYLNGDEENTDTYSTPFIVPEGTNTLHYYSIDTSSNKEIPLTRTFKVDTKAPSSDVSISPESPNSPAFNGWYVTLPEIKIRSDEEGSSYYGWDDDEARKYTGNVDVPEGKHDLHYWSEDEAGNVEEAQKFDLKVDTMTPITMVRLTPENPCFENDGWFNETVRVELVPDEAAETYYAWDNDNYRYYSGALDAPEGAHFLYHYSVDEAGNQEGINEMLIKTDTKCTFAELSIYPPLPDGDNGFYVDLPEIYLSCEEEDGLLYYHWDEEKPVLYDPLLSEIIVREGIHNLTYYAVDRANNREESNTITISVDISPPMTELIRIPGKPDGEEGWYNELIVSLSSPNEDIRGTYYRFSDDMKKKTYNGPLGPDELGEGTRTLYYYSVDRAGNKGSERSFTFSLDRVPPRAQVRTSARVILEGELLTISALASTDNVEVGEYLFVFGDMTQTSWMSEGNVSHTYEKSGTYTIGLRVKDRSGLESNISQVKLTVKPKEDESGIIPLVPSEGIYQYGIMTAGVLILVFFLVLVIAMIRKRGKRKEERGWANEGEKKGEGEEEGEGEEGKRGDNNIEEAEKLYGKKAFTSKVEKDDDAGDEYQKLYGSPVKESEYDYGEWKDVEWTNTGSPVISKANEAAICGICFGVVKPGLELVTCGCGKRYHGSCGRRVDTCPVCGSSLAAETLLTGPESYPELSEGAPGRQGEVEYLPPGREENGIALPCNGWSGEYEDTISECGNHYNREGYDHHDEMNEYYEGEFDTGMNEDFNGDEFNVGADENFNGDEGDVSGDGDPDMDDHNADGYDDDGEGYISWGEGEEDEEEEEKGDNNLDSWEL